jgi:hypothetical protein
MSTIIRTAAGKKEKKKKGVGTITHGLQKNSRLF